MRKLREFLNLNKPDVWKAGSFLAIAAGIGSLAVESIPTDYPMGLKVATVALTGVATVASWIQGDRKEYPDYLSGPSEQESRS